MKICFILGPQKSGQCGITDYVNLLSNALENDGQSVKKHSIELLNDAVSYSRNLLEGNPIQVFGDGRQRRDYNYVDDVVDALLLAATRPEAKGKIFNLGTPDPLSLKDTAKLMCDQIERANYEKIPFPEDRKAIDVDEFVCDYQAFQAIYRLKPSGWKIFAENCHCDNQLP